MEPRSDDPAVLVWIDVETTGLDPFTDSLLEVSVHLTTPRMHPVRRTLPNGKTFPAVYHSCVYRGSAEQVENLRNSSTDVVREMHDRSGLWGRVSDPVTARSLSDVDLDLVRLLFDSGVTHKTRAWLAGSSVKFDYDFVREHLPLFHESLHYRVLDVTSVSAALRWWSSDDPQRLLESSKRNLHTSEEDLSDTMAEAYRCLRFLRGRGEV